MPSHSWDGRRGNWEEHDDAELDWPAGDCSDSDDEVRETEMTPGMEFVKVLLRLLFIRP